ncbi:cell division protein FtsX [Capnocytophaga canimorsus]|uniref:Cell division protein FtsX n=1 Tax=Capnocytophaga canimorsus TaxID=28188 RepID=A0A0B7H4F9_9FLAO|nr:permease-like cell division protein FtsX [Capnocytophaga canimorsus]ATA76640.1 ABC transporter permease [Capnocytophaga canimorsus]ATA91253.1 ABC transporter permease [Capnocytophaga canimorsus]ATA93362.1 ABC transporter permease [Capnocytophaga canimorsus]AWL78100.1 ABC transporter permease [Capnocytophaga canimorsus]AYW36736.1 FtsX-like permease family protein [Capnocytophaga canimorsus]
MAKSIDKFNKRRLITSYFSVTLSITLVLFLLGLLGFLLLNAQRLANYFKEQVSVSISLKDDAKEADVLHLQKTLSVAEFAKSVRFVSKEEAAEQFSQEIGEDFLSFIGVNPLQNSIDLSLKAEYAEPGKMEEIAKEIGQNPFVTEVTYDKPLVALIHENVEKISLIILIISGLFTIIAILLINSSIRLSIYSKRFTIKTMQLVGATRGFIRRPFIITNVRLGIYGAVFAMLLLYGCISYLNNSFPEFGLMTDRSITIMVFSSILIIGILITWLSTFFAAQRFLNLNTNDLYY